LGFLLSGADEDLNLRGQEVRVERSETTLRSNGPQGEPRSGKSSSITDQIQKNPTARLGFLLSGADEDLNLRGQIGRSSEVTLILYHHSNAATSTTGLGFFLIIY